MDERQRTRVVIYARKSADDGSEESKSVADQVADLRAQAEGKGWDIVAVESDDGVSGWVWGDGRPGIQRALAVEADVLAVWWTHRIARDDVRRELIMRDLESRGQKLWVGASRVWVDRSTVSGFMTDKVDALIGAYTSRQISETWRDALRRRRDKGLVSGKARFGYEIPAHEDGTPVKEVPQVPVEPQATELRNMYRRFIGGAGLQTLAKDLNSRKVPAPGGGTWAPITVSRILSSGFGAGLIARGGRKNKDGVDVPLTYIPGAQEPVITADEWTRYLDAAAARKQVPVKARGSAWNLRGLVKCGLCGAAVSMAGVNVVCSRAASGKQCTGVTMRRYLVDHEVNLWTLMHLDDLAATLPDRSAARTAAQASLDALQAKADAADAALGRLASGWAKGLLDDAGYEAARVDLLQEKNALADGLREARDELDRLGGEPSDALDDLATRFEQAPEMSPAEYGKHLGKVLRKVELHPDRLVLFPVVGEPETVARKRRKASSSK